MKIITVLLLMQIVAYNSSAETLAQAAPSAMAQGGLSAVDAGSLFKVANQLARPNKDSSYGYPGPASKVGEFSAEGFTQDGRRCRMALYNTNIPGRDGANEFNSISLTIVVFDKSDAPADSAGSYPTGEGFGSEVWISADGNKFLPTIADNVRNIDVSVASASPNALEIAASERTDTGFEYISRTKVEITQGEIFSASSEVRLNGVTKTVSCSQPGS